MARNLMAVLAGFVAAFVAIFAIETLSGQLYPMPEGIGPDNSGAVEAWLAGLPVTAFLLVLLSYVAGAFCGGLVAGLVARNPLSPSLAVGVLLTLGAILNFVTIAHPAWMVMVSLPIFIPLAWLGGRAGGRRPEQYLAR